MSCRGEKDSPLLPVSRVLLAHPAVRRPVAPGFGRKIRKYQDTTTRLRARCRLRASRLRASNIGGQSKHGIYGRQYLNCIHLGAQGLARLVQTANLCLCCRQPLARIRCLQSSRLLCRSCLLWVQPPALAFHALHPAIVRSAVRSTAYHIFCCVPEVAAAGCGSHCGAPAALQSPAAARRCPHATGLAAAAAQRSCFGVPHEAPAPHCWIAAGPPACSAPAHAAALSCLPSCAEINSTRVNMLLVC